MNTITSTRLPSNIAILCHWAGLLLLIFAQPSAAGHNRLTETATASLADGQQSQFFYVTKPDNADPVSVAKTWNRLETAYATLDITLVAIEVPIARMYLMAAQGSADGAMVGFAENIEPRYPHLIRVKPPLFKTRYDIYGYGESGSIESWEDVGTERVAAIRGFDTAASHLAESQIVWVNTAEQLVDMVQQKRVRYFLGLEQQSEAILAKRNANASLRGSSKSKSAESEIIRRLSETPMHVVTLNHYLSSRHADLGERLGKALTAQHLAAD